MLGVGLGRVVLFVCVCELLYCLRVDRVLYSLRVFFGLVVFCVRLLCFSSLFFVIEFVFLRLRLIVFFVLECSSVLLLLFFMFELCSVFFVF